MINYYNCFILIVFPFIIFDFFDLSSFFIDLLFIGYDTIFLGNSVALFPEYFSIFELIRHDM